MILNIAFATDDGENFTDKHFGDACEYLIYKFANDGFEFINKIANTVDEKEEVHADPNKAKGIAGLLKNENVHVAVTKIFGPNIKRIKSKFVCIIVKSEKITDSFDILKTNFDIILNEWAKGDDRNFLKF